MVQWDAEKKGDPISGASEGFFTHEFGRVRRILRPDGRKLHIAHSPEEVKNLTRRLSTVSPLDDDWEVVIHGSLEHVRAFAIHAKIMKHTDWDQCSTIRICF
jgi:hypothetical protein